MTEKANMVAKRKKGFLDNFFTVVSETRKAKCLRANVSKGRGRTKKSNSILFYQKLPLGR